MYKPDMTIVIYYDEGELHLDTDEAPAVHLDDALHTFPKVRVPTVINEAMKCLELLRDEWNRMELAARAEMNRPEKGE